MDKILEVQNVSKNFGPVQVLNGVTISIDEGESISILGPSGSGKSTLLHIGGMMEKPSQGTIQILGQETADFSENELASTRLNTIGFLFQFHHLLPDFNVLENVLIPARLANDNLKEKEAEALAMLERLKLKDRLHHRPFQLSGGEQQRVALIRALIRKPKLLLCDEPTGNLDNHTAHEMMELIWEEVKNRKLAAMIVTHNEELARKANKSYHLVNGKIQI